MAERHFKALAPGEVSGFCAQLAMLLRSGVPTQDALELMQDTCTAEEQALLQSLILSLAQGGAFCTALKETGAFPEYLIEMVRLGEEAGSLDEACGGLADYYEREQDVRDSVRSAVTYPVVMIVLLLLVLGVLAVRVLPVFAGVFEQLGGVSALSERTLRIGRVLGAVSAVLTGILVLLGAGLFAAYRSEKGRRRAAALLCGLPVFRGIFEKIALERFTSAMALLLKSGFDAATSLSMSGTLLDGTPLAGRAKDCIRRTGEGEPLGDALRETKLLPASAARLAAVGVRTGSLDAAMASIAGHCAKDARESVDDAAALIEPVLVAVLSVVVGLILLSVMTPLLGVMSAIG